MYRSISIQQLVNLKKGLAIATWFGAHFNIPNLYSTFTSKIYIAERKYETIVLRMTEHVKIILWYSNIADQRNLGNVVS